MVLSTERSCMQNKLPFKLVQNKLPFSCYFKITMLRSIAFYWKFIFNNSVAILNFSRRWTISFSLK